jgi:hypothetical protein
MNKPKYFTRALLLLTVFVLITSACSGAMLTASEPGYADMVEVEEPVANRDTFSGESYFGGDEGVNIEQSIPQTSERIVIRNADISVVVDDPAESMDQITRMADEMGGFVVSSNVYQMHLDSGIEVPSANITIRVPAELLDDALDNIEELASRVLSENQSGQDVTREYTDLQSRLRNLESAEAQLAEIMDEASKTEDVLNVYNELVYLREQIEVIQGQIQYYEQSAALSAISVSLTADAAVQPLTIGGWQPVGVAKDAIQALIDTLQVLGNLAIWFVLYVLPVLLCLLIPLAILWTIFRAWRRRRKMKTSAVPEKVQPPEGGTEA